MTESLLHFCPACGREGIALAPPREYRCGGCGWHYFFNVAGAVGAIITCGDEMMFGVRAEDPAAGKWDIIGGFLDFDESAEEALVRELREELGIEFRTDQLRYICSEPNTYRFDGVLYHTIDLIYAIELDSKPAVMPADDLADIVWVSQQAYGASAEQKLAFDSSRRAVRRYLNSLEL